MFQPAIADNPNTIASPSSTDSSPDIWDDPELLKELLGDSSAENSKASTKHDMSVDSFKASTKASSKASSKASTKASSKASSKASTKASSKSSVVSWFNDFDRELTERLEQQKKLEQTKKQQSNNALYHPKPYDYLEQKRKYNLENHILLSPDVSNNYVFNSNWTFQKVIPKYKTSFPGLYNNSEYLIRYQAYNNRYYPVIKLPKGLMLFNAVDKHNFKNKSELFNLGKTGEVINTDLRFFYPMPLACRGVSEYGYNYKYTNICVLSHDIYLMCMLSPTSQTRHSMKDPSEAQVLYQDKPTGENYYNTTKRVTYACTTHYYDVCIDPQAMHDMGLQGYITIATNDSISHGDTWEEIITALYNKQPSTLAQQVIEKMMLSSCMNSAKMDPRTNIEMEKLKAISQTYLHLSEENKNRVFGIPEIVLSPINSAYFKLPNNKNYIDRSNVRDVYGDPNIDHEDLYKYLFNYEPIDYVQVDDVAQWLSTHTANIKRSLQAPCFYMYTPNVDDFPSKYLIDTNIPINSSHVDYIAAYEKDTSICAFETYTYNLKTTTGGRTLHQRPISYKHIKRVKHGRVRKKRLSPHTKRRRHLKMSVSAVEKIYLPKYDVNVNMQLSTNGIPVVWV